MVEVSRVPRPKVVTIVLVAWNRGPAWREQEWPWLAALAFASLLAAFLWSAFVFLLRTHPNM